MSEPAADHFDFSHALALLKQGKRVARAAWKEWGEVAWLKVKHDNAGHPYMSAHDIRWSPAQADIFAEDWHEVTG